MDAIKKKMNSLKTETEQMQERIKELEEETQRANKTSDQCELDIRDIGKKTAQMETAYDDTFSALIATEHKLEEKEKLLAVCEQDISSLCRRLTLLEGESWTAETRLGKMTIDLANVCKQADEIQRRARQLESKCMNNEANIEDLEKLLHEAKTMYADSDKKLDESTRRLGVMEEELKRSEERAALSESNIRRLEDELKSVGENMKALEVAEERALEREEKYKDQIRTLVSRLKSAESRIEYGEMNITKLNHRIDDIEDEIVREKLKIEKVGDQVGQTLDDIFTKY